MEIKKLPTALVELNEGQVEGLPSNPRSWTYAELDYLRRSLQETPELFEARGLIVIRHGDRYVTLGGNMRLVAAKANGMAEVPAFVLPDATPTEKLREIVMKDNSSFGSWDWDGLAAEWRNEAKAEWGVPIPVYDEQEEKPRLDVGAELVTMEVDFDPDEFVYVTQNLLKHGDTISQGLLNLLGYGAA